MKVTSISVNCGNDKSGIEQQIRQMLTDGSPDILTINAQEVKFAAEVQSISKALKGTNYAVIALPPRITATKPGVFFSRDTGLCNFVIYDKTKFNPPSSTSERSKEIVSLSGLSNKGALINRVELQPLGEGPPLRLELIAGHLDSNKTHPRLAEWHKIYKSTHPTVKSWEQLVDTTADMTIGGFDANVRYAVGDSTNYWQGAGNEETKTYLNTLPLGIIKSSAEPTYNKVLLEQMGLESASLDSSETTSEVDSGGLSIEEMSRVEGKRAGLADMGNLDILTIKTGRETDISHSISCTTIPFDGSTKRDHSAVVYHFEHTPYTNEFEKVAAHVLTELKLFDQGRAGSNIHQQLSDALAQEGLGEAEKKAILVDYYNEYVVRIPSLEFEAQLEASRSRSNSGVSSPSSSRSSSPTSLPEEEIIEEVYNPMHTRK